MADATPIRYAVMITLPGVTASDEDRGLFSGSLCWITGDDFITEPIDPPDNPVTEAPQEEWALGMLMEDSFGNPSFDVNLDCLGEYGDQSDLELRANLVRLTVDFLYTYSLYHAEVRFFVVVGLTFREWTRQKVESFTFEAQSLNVYCIDLSKDAHQEIPKEKTDRNAFPRISPQQETKYIPICIGRIPKALLLGVSGDGERIPMYKAAGVEYAQTAVAVYDSTDALANIQILRFITGDLVVSANQWAGKFLACIGNGPSDQMEILSNEASSGGHTLVRLASPIKVGNTEGAINFWRNDKVLQSGTAQGAGEAGGWNYITLATSALAVDDAYEGDLVYISSGPGAGQGAFIAEYQGSTRRARIVGVWTTTPTSSSGYQVLDQGLPGRGMRASWFQLHAQTFTYIVSGNPVSSFPQGRKAYFWDGEGRRFWSAYNAVASTHPNGLPGYGSRSGVVIQGTDPKLSNAVIQSYFPITPASVRFVSLVVRDEFDEVQADLTLESENFPTTGVECPELFDVDKESFLTWTASKTSTATNQMRSTLVLDIEFPAFDYDAGLDGLFIAFNATHELECADDVRLGMDLRWSVTGRDILDASGLEQINNLNPPALINYKGRTDGFLLGNVYSEDGVEAAQNGILEDYFGGDGPTNYHRVMANYTLGNLPLGAREIECIKFLRITIHFTGQIYTSGLAIDNDHIHKVINRIHEVCLYGKKQVDQNPDKVFIPVIGDKFQGTWGGRKTDGNPILRPSDAAEQIIRAYDERPDLIDTESFDLASIDRPSSTWSVSMQLLEGKNSAEYLSQLCAEMMAIMTPRHNGTRTLRCWRERFTSYVALSEPEIIEDSIREVGDVDMSQVYTEYELRYDKNTADGSHLRTVAIRKTDADAFPDEDELDADPVDLSGSSIGYARADGRVGFIYTVSDFTISPGTYFSLTGGFGGFAVDKVQILEAEVGSDDSATPGIGYFTILDEGYSMLVDHTVYFDVTTATHYPSIVQVWKQYVVGVPDYDVAKDQLWTPCHEAWLLTRTRNTLRLDFDFFGSNEDWGGSALNDAPVSWLKVAVGPYGIAKPMKKTGFQLPITADHLALELGQGFAFRSGIFTGGRWHYAWFTRLSLNSKESRIDVEIIFNPWSEV